MVLCVSRDLEHTGEQEVCFIWEIKLNSSSCPRRVVSMTIHPENLHADVCDVTGVEVTEVEYVIGQSRDNLICVSAGVPDRVCVELLQIRVQQRFC